MPGTPFTVPLMRILLVEDDPLVADGIVRGLTGEGYVVDHVGTAEPVSGMMDSAHYDLAIIDLGLPGEDGLSLVKRLAEQEIPVVVLTARGDLDSRIAGLNAGALQYFVKPTDMNELVAGIRSQLRRNTGQPARAAAPFLTWRLDPLSACMVAPNHQIIALTSRELELLGCLMATPGTMVAKQTLIETMGYADVDDGFHRIESQLTRLRRKTLDISGLALPVRAVFGRGLVFVP